MPTLSKQTVSWIPEGDRTYTLTLTGRELFTVMDAVRRRGAPGPEVFEVLQAQVRTVHALTALSKARKARGEPSP